MSAQQLADLQAQLDRTRAELSARDEAERQRQAQAREAAAVAFAESAISTARVPAERRDHLVALHKQLAAGADGAVVMFGEGDTAVAATEVLNDLVALIPPTVEFGEHADLRRRAKAGELGDLGLLDDTDAQVQFAEGVHLDPERLALHQQVLDIQRQARAKGQTLSYQQALSRVPR